MSPFGGVRPIPEESESDGEDNNEDDELFPIDRPLIPLVKAFVDQSEKLCEARLLLSPPRAELRTLLPEDFPIAVPV